MTEASKVLVTGGAGFIGSNLVDRLVREGYRVGILDNFSTGEISNINKADIEEGRIQLHRGDITDYQLVRAVVKDYEAIYHEAALPSVARSIEDPLLVNEVNVTGTLNLLKAAVDLKVKKVVYASSSSVYGESVKLPKVETMSSLPVSPYGASKLAAENYCRVFAKVYGLPTVCLRYFNVYGPRQKYGHYSGVIPIFITRLRNDLPPVIFGDGEQVRDFTYVQDVVEANVLALRRDVNPGEVFNIASGGTTSIKQLAELLAKLVGKPHIAPEFVEERPGDIRASHADISKAGDALGYRPRFVPAQGLPTVIEWFSRDKAPVANEPNPA
ncbi:MAG: SDR family oxidoreductase [Thaumarchaeota archaeon]|nr:SDR family oxidoreductase [Nitrososphaerota archaeon]